MEKIIGRTAEQKLLKSALESPKAELVAVYGRRRVGKTYLIRSVYDGKIVFELSGLHNGTLYDQLDSFQRRLAAKGGESRRPTSWMQAFGYLESYLDQLKTTKKKVIFLDEFPWLASRRSKFLMAFEDFWNRYASRRSDLLVVICGSAAAYIAKNILRNRGGLHNRVTRRIRLLPFDLHDTQAFLRSKGIRFSQYDILQIYMAIGGIPQYLDNLTTGESVVQAIDRLCFGKDAPMRNEFSEVFASLFDHPQRHSSIIRTLAKTRGGLTRNEISKKTKLPTGGRLTITLEELEESGFIERYTAFGRVKKDALYRLTDEYSLFFLKFMDNPQTKEIGGWKKQFNSPSYRSWAGFSFETVCLKHVRQIKAELGIAEVASENYSWIEKGNADGAQIDLVIDRADRVINLFEMKFHSGAVTLTKSDAEDIRNKIQVFEATTRTSKIIFFTMMTTHGVKENAYSLELIQNQLTMSCLFKSYSL